MKETTQTSPATVMEPAATMTQVVCREKVYSCRCLCEPGVMIERSRSDSVQKSTFNVTSTADASIIRSRDRFYRVERSKRLGPR